MEPVIGSPVMTRPDHAPHSLAILIDKLVAFLLARQKLNTGIDAGESPNGLARVFDSFGHHLVPLMLLARADDDLAASERDMIVDYCEGRARQSGFVLTPDERTALQNHVRRIHLLPMQLAPAVERLKHDSKADIAALLSAAHALVEADGVVRMQETSFLLSLQDDLNPL
jgi:hypothetical protein